MGKRVSFKCNGLTDLDLVGIQTLAGVSALALLPRGRRSGTDPHLRVECENGNRLTIMRSLTAECQFDFILRDENGYLISEDEEVPLKALMSVVAQAARPQKPARKTRKRARHRVP
jgi:hypothetical protein